MLAPTPPKKYVRTNEITIEATIAIAAFLTLLKSSQIYTGRAVKPAVALAYVLILVKPANKPTIAPLAITQNNGFFKGIVTPYRAGSVIPNKAVVPELTAVDFISLSLLLKATAKQAPA